MCGRFTLIHSPEVIASTFQLNTVPSLEARYNIAPTQLIPTTLLTSGNSDRLFKTLHWGLIPAWAKNSAIGAKLINARAETVAEKPAFRSAFKHRRCLIIADGFYEWQRQGGKKQPFYFRLQNQQPFAFAGLWERWQAPDGEAIDSCTILTTAANELVQSIHDRMPVIIDSKDYDLWLDPTLDNSEALQQLLCPYPSEAMTSYAVSTRVNSPTYSNPDCINSL